MPFLWSLDRNREQLPGRVAHGVIFGGLLAALCLPASPAAWCGFVLSAVLFAAAAGPVLRARGGWPALVGLPILWTGIEVLRDALASLGASPLAGWLALGYCAAPGLPDAEIASVVGIHGLSILLALGSTAYFLVLRARTGGRQIAVAAAATLLPLATHAAGSFLAREAPPRDGVAVVVATEPRGDAASLIRLTEPLAAGRPRLVVWPGPPAVRGEGTRAVSDLAVRLDATILLGITENNEGGSGVRHAVLVVGPDGGIVGRVAMTEAGEPEPARGGTRIFPLGPGRFGLAAGSELATPAVARRLARDGAGILVLATADGGAGSPSVERLRDRMALFRAIENRRFVARSGRRTAFLADPHGRRLVFVEAGLEGAAMEDAAILEEKSAYAIAGWLVEPCSLASAIGLLALSAIRGVRKGLNARSPAGPPAVPREPFRT